MVGFKVITAAGPSPSSPVRRRGWKERTKRSVLIREEGKHMKSRYEAAVFAGAGAVAPVERSKVQFPMHPIREQILKLRRQQPLWRQLARVLVWRR